MYFNDLHCEVQVLVQASLRYVFVLNTMCVMCLCVFCVLRYVLCELCERFCRVFSRLAGCVEAEDEVLQLSV